MALYKNINSIKMKTIGAVVFIRLLLLISGVEPNPGPPDVLVFRYQYLLIEVGTILLRKLFDAKVGYDLMLYLRKNGKAAKKLMALGNDILTAEQKKLLPPQDNNPNTANFDITLLFCLLRNICGLKPHTDAVWKCPASSDTSVEAEITRLKKFRNLVVHRGTVYISESDFNQKWSELCQILHRLNNFCGVPNLSEMIDSAKSKPLDDQLKEKHDNILKAWHEAESLFEKGILEIKQTQSELIGGQSEIKQTQSELMGGQIEIKQTQTELMGGQTEIKQTQSELMGGQTEIKQTQSELMGGQTEIKQTQSELMGGQTEIKQTQSELLGGQTEIKQTQSELMGGQTEIKQTQSELTCGQSEIKQTQSELIGGQSEIKQTQSELMGGQIEIKQTQTELMGGQTEIKQTQSELMGGQTEIKQTQFELMGGQTEIKQTQSELMGGQTEIKQTQSELLGGQTEIKQTQSELMGGQTEIKQTQSELTCGQSEIKQTQSELLGGQTEIKQTQSELMGGQTEIKQTQSELTCGQSEIKQTQFELMGGQTEIIQTQSELTGGQSEIKQTQSELMGGQTEIKQTQSELMGGQSEIKQTQSVLMGGQFEIKQTQSELKDGQSGIKQTQSELKDGQSEIKQLQSVLMGGQFEIKQTQSEMNVGLNEIPKLLNNVQDLQEQAKKILDNSEQHDRSNKRIKSSTNEDIQQQLIKIYQKDICSGLPLFPLLEDETESILRLYELPTMYVVNYHRFEKQRTDKSPDNLAKVKTCSDLFHVKDKDCKNIYLTGDAGVGKTSFSKFLSLLWCKSKFGTTLDNDHMQGYIDYLARFDFVFYVNLRDTDFTDLIAIIVDQLFYSENKDKSNKMYDKVEEILGNHHSLVIMDGLDEWIPKVTAKRKNELPVRPQSECVYLTTCRPYKIENIRLSETNLDHQVKMTGLGKKEIESYVSNLIDIVNTKYNENKIKEEFMMAVQESNLLDLLHIPMITCHLVMLWFDRPLTSMSQSLIYGNILDMLFKLAHKKEIAIPLCKTSKLKFPDPLSELNHFKDHFSQVEQLCLLSFKLLFEHDTDITSLVFTREQLASEPYCLSEVETDFCCTIGILSKNKVKRKFGKQEHKLSFLHKSYLEFFAAIYASTLEISNVLELFRQCRTINDVLEYKNFLIFYAGLSIENLVSLITKMYTQISKDLDLTRVLSIFSSDIDDKRGQWLSLQNLILKCYIDGSYQMANSLPLEDFISNRKITIDTETETKYLRKLILSNLKNIRQLRLDDGVYFDFFDKFTHLQVLHISPISDVNRAFYSLMKQNKSSLQIISILGGIYFPSLLPSHLPLEDLHYLTSLSLRFINISHEDIQYLTKFLCNNSQLKHLKLSSVSCTEHAILNSDICGSFELVQCNKLVYLEIDETNIACTNINTSSLEHITLRTKCKSIAKGYNNIINSIQYALELKHLCIDGNTWLDEHLVETLITNVQYLSKIERVILREMTIRDNVSFLLHPSVKQVSIVLSGVIMTDKWFHTFLENVINQHCCIILVLSRCIIGHHFIESISGKKENEEKSCKFIYDCIKSISAIKNVKFNYIYWPDVGIIVIDNQ